MTVEEAVAAVDFWTPNDPETQMFGSTTSQEAAAAFNCTVSVPREAWSNPTGPRNYDVRVSRFLMVENEETGEREKRENPTYVLVAEEIKRRQAEGRKG